MTPIVQHYVFGYGSLICSKSRAISAPSLASRAALPVRINNVVRTWNKRSPKSGATYLGVQQVQDHTASCVGVLVPMDATSTQQSQEELEALDEREDGYDRHSVPLKWINRVDDLLLPSTDNVYRGTFLDTSATTPTTAFSKMTAADISVWMYVPQVSQPATMKFPIAQSYVDVCLRGCLSISEPFLQEFITSTVGWDPQELIDMEEEASNSQQQEQQDQDDAATMVSSKGWHHRSSSSLSSYDPRTMMNSNSNNNMRDSSEFKSITDVMDWDDMMMMEDGDNNNDNLFIKAPSSQPDAWVNDRKDPIYMRADRAYSLEHADAIDDFIVATMARSGDDDDDDSNSSPVAPTAVQKKKSSWWQQLRVARGKKELQRLRKRNTGSSTPSLGQAPSSASSSSIEGGATKAQ